MGKCRVTQRSGRIGHASHNDRTFLQGRNVEEVAPHINPERLDKNVALCWKPGMEFEKAELLYYTEKYAAACKATNERYIREGHPERCKTPEDLYRGRLTKPEELILQIGDMNTGVNVRTFIDCVNDYLEEFNRWNLENGEHGHVLDIAIHIDEKSPHAHIRRVWDSLDKDGLTRLGQNRALEAAGVPLPVPEKKVSRYNNRKMTFDAMMREKWQEICKNHGYDIETVPRPNKKHKDKADYIAEQLSLEINKKLLEKDLLEDNIKYLNGLLNALEGQISERNIDSDIKIANLESKVRKYESVFNQFPELKAVLEKIKDSERVK